MSNGYNDHNSASKLLESVLEDMNNIMKVNEEFDSNTRDAETNIMQYDEYKNGNNNSYDMSADKRFELMVEEMQNCLKDTADVRNIVQNISSDRRDFFTSIFKPDTENNLAVSHKVDLMDEISRQKLDIAYLQRDKQALLNQITDLNNKVSMLTDENRKLKQELNMMKIDELDYCIPPNEIIGDNVSNNDSHQSKESGMSAFLRNDSPLATSTPDKSKSPNSAPIVPLHAKQRNELQQRALPAEFLQKISPDIHIKESSGKSSSWSELRSNQIIQDENFPTMTPPSQRKNSVNNLQIVSRTRSFGKNESKIYSADNKRKMKLLSNKSNGNSPLDLDGTLDFSMSSQPVSQNINALALLAVNERLGNNSKFSRNSPLRMTAGPRLLTGHNKLKQTEAAVQRVLSLSNPNLQSCSLLLPCKSDFKMWSKDHICAFLHQIGLGSYANNCRRWLLDGLQLIQASRREIEKELNITNKLHLKKLLIHIRQLTSMHVPAATYFSLARPKLKIAANFNTRLWLDDIGLLHYMSLFSANCVDGYMLDQISLEDLQHLKITNELHTLSLKRGIQLLREIDYDLSFLIRRPSEDTFNSPIENGSGDNLEITCNVPPGEVCRWTQHQVMEWLRRIELPEYASNIRGSGIHGALLILEDRFNANSLASVLNIPQNRSLLRRHLQAKFQELIGSSVVAKKKKAAESADFVPLSTTSKLKYHRKKSFFSVIKRKPLYEPAEELLVSYTNVVEDLDLNLQMNQESMILTPDN